MVESERLECVYTGNRIAGSNPVLSANYTITAETRIVKLFNYCFKPTSRIALLPSVSPKTLLPISK